MPFARTWPEKQQARLTTVSKYSTKFGPGRPINAITHESNPLALSPRWRGLVPQCRSASVALSPCSESWARGETYPRGDCSFSRVDPKGSWLLKDPKALWVFLHHCNCLWTPGISNWQIITCKATIACYLSPLTHLDSSERLRYMVLLILCCFFSLNLWVSRSLMNLVGFPVNPQQINFYTISNLFMRLVSRM